MNIQKEIEKVKAELESIKFAEAYLPKLERKLNYDKTHLINIGKLIDDKYKDIGQLESFTIKRLFIEFLGDKESQLERERQQYLQLALKYRELKQTIKLMEYERDILQEKVNNLDKVQLKLNALIKARENLLKDVEKETKEKVIEINIKIDQKIRLITEIKEAKEIGYKIKEKLQRATDNLKKINTWSEIENFFSNSTPPKQNHLDNAQEDISAAQQLLIRLENELNDIWQLPQQQQPSRYTTFLEDYNENLIIDWLLAGQIKNARHLLENTSDKVEIIIQRLKKEEALAKKYAQNLDKEKRKVLLQKKKKA